VEIQRLIGRSLRAAIDLEALGEFQITIDCDVIQADGGTRCAAITGGYVALAQAVRLLQKTKKITSHPIKRQIAAVSAGVIKGVPLLDLDYAEDSSAEVDFNVIMTSEGNFVEVQGTAEGKAFARATLDEMLDLTASGINELFAAQRVAIETPKR
jgi:ribonuclease PH